MKKYFLWLAMALTALTLTMTFTACGGDDDDEDELEDLPCVNPPGTGVVAVTDEPQVLSYKFVELFGTVYMENLPDEVLSLELGFEVSEDKAFSAPIRFIGSYVAEGSSKFSTVAFGLAPSTQYYCRAYVDADSKVYYGSVKSFTMPEAPAEAVTAVTGQALNITSNSVTLTGSVSNLPAGAKSIEYGVEVSETNSFASFKRHVATGTSFSISVTSLTPSKQYFYRTYINADTKFYYGSVSSFITLDEAPAATHEAVDLGFLSGTLWATCNVGANSPEEPGYYFAWGEIAPKEVYSWDTYTKYDKYVKYSTYGELQPVDDAATMSEDWGSGWYTPSFTDFSELVQNTNWLWITYKGVPGYKVTSKINGNSIFLPAAGSRPEEKTGGKAYGCYWTRTIYSYDITKARDLYFYNEGRDCSGFTDVWKGSNIRPVRNK